MAKRMVRQHLLGVDYEPLPQRTHEDMLMLTERLKLIRLSSRTPTQESRLLELDKYVASMQVHPASQHEFINLMMGMAKDAK